MILLVLSPSLVSSSRESCDGETSPTSSDAMTAQGVSGTRDLTITANPTSHAKQTRPEFSIGATPSALAIAISASSTSTITIDPINGFNGLVALTVRPLKDIIATLSPAAITASGSSIMTIRLDASITPGTYTIEVQGRSGKLRNDAFISVTVVPEFSIGATLPSAVPADGTTTATSIIVVRPANNFAGTVTLSDTPLPSGLTCTEIIPSRIIDSFGSATLTCRSSTPGAYTVTVTGTSGSLTHSALAFFDFIAVGVSATSPLNS